MANRLAYVNAAWAFHAYKCIESATVQGYVTRSDVVPAEGPERTALLIDRKRESIEQAARESAQWGWNIKSTPTPEDD